MILLGNSLTLSLLQIPTERLLQGDDPAGDLPAAEPPVLSGCQQWRRSGGSSTLLRVSLHQAGHTALITADQIYCDICKYNLMCHFSFPLLSPLLYPQISLRGKIKINDCQGRDKAPAWTESGCRLYHHGAMVHRHSGMKQVKWDLGQWKYWIFNAMYLVRNNDDDIFLGADDFHWFSCSSELLHNQCCRAKSAAVS